jgi:hypothetical protein
METEHQRIMHSFSLQKIQLFVAHIVCSKLRVSEHL